MKIIHPTYFPNVAHFAVMLQNPILFEVHDNYQKQTYRNRMYLYGANGKQLLTIPIKHTKDSGHQKYKDVQIEYNFNWQKQHWKTIQTAYRTSPFFEFYEDDLAPVFNTAFKFLLDFNLNTIEAVTQCIDVNLILEKTSQYQETYPLKTDFRFLVNAKKEPIFNFEDYVQVFHLKHGFIENLSVLDVLFNLGPESIQYLENQEIYV